MSTLGVAALVGFAIGVVVGYRRQARLTRAITYLVESHASRGR